MSRKYQVVYSTNDRRVRFIIETIETRGACSNSTVATLIEPPFSEGDAQTLCRRLNSHGPFKWLRLWNPL